jgi:acetyl esterase/lipase
MLASRFATQLDKPHTGSLMLGVSAMWLCLVVSSWSMAQEAKEPLGASQGFSKRTLGSSPSRVKVHFDVSYCEQNDPLQVADVYMPPSGDIEHQARYPAILAIHGGAWVAGDKRFDALHCRKMAEQGYVVMAINYRLAPKHKHPAQIDDCREALRWLSHHADQYHIACDRSQDTGSADQGVCRRWCAGGFEDDPRGLSGPGWLPRGNPPIDSRSVFEGIAD